MWTRRACIPRLVAASLQRKQSLHDALERSEHLNPKMAMQAPMCDLLQGFQVWSDLDEANPGLVNVSNGSRKQDRSGDLTVMAASNEMRQPNTRSEDGSNILLRILRLAPKQKDQ